jgi:hypothetical protein
MRSKMAHHYDAERQSGVSAVGLIEFGRRIFGRKGASGAHPEPQDSNEPKRSSGDTPFDRHFDLTVRLAASMAYPHPEYKCSEALEILSPSERGELLIDLIGRPGLYSGGWNNSDIREKVVRATYHAIWRHEPAVSKEHLGPLLHLLLNDKWFREGTGYISAFGGLLKLIDSAIAQGAYLSSVDCEALAQMASEIRGSRKSHSKADTKRMIARAERIEKLAGTTVSATTLLMQRCEGADNSWAIAPGERANARFWADLLAEVTAGLETIRGDTKGAKTPAWMRSPDAFAAIWPACGDVTPVFERWDAGSKALAALSQHNGKRSGFADAEVYRHLPHCIALAQPHSRYNWRSDQIPGLDIFADLENPDWTALAEHLITQRRATRATAAWQKEALALCQPIGLPVVEARLHDWLALFHTPALDRSVYTALCNGERFASAIDQLEESHGDWPERHAEAVTTLGRAIAMKVASGDTAGLCPIFHSQLIRLDDFVYKNSRVTDGILGLPKPLYRHADGHATYETMAGWLCLGVENEEFLRGAVWLAALMPDRARAIDALEKVAQTAATYMWVGDDAMRSKIVANAAIATLIAMGGPDIDPAVLRLSKTIENRTINPPLFQYLNRNDRQPNSV